MISEFLISCSGADKGILKDCPTEKTKFVGIGATVFITGILASLSGGYAIYFTFNSVPIAILIGIFWGIVIFSLDRYIVSSIKKTGIFLEEFWMATPRIFMAIVLAIVVSKPLELRLFNDAISKQMGEIARGSISDCETNFNLERDKLAKRKSELENELITKKEDIYSKDKVFNDFASQKSGVEGENRNLQAKVNSNNITISNGWIPPFYNDGILVRKGHYTNAANAAKNENSQLRNTLNLNNSKINAFDTSMQSRKTALLSQVISTEQQYAQQISGIQQQIIDHNASRDKVLKKCETEANNAQDIPARLEALSSLSNKNSSINWASWMITILFIILETAPVVVKLLSKRGPYDEVLDRIEYESFIEQKKLISNKNDEINNLLQEIRELNKLKGEVRLKTEKAKLEAELKANQSLLENIAIKQSDLAKIAIDKWYDDELNKLKGSQSQQYASTKQAEPIKSTFEEVLWKKKNTTDEIFYLFSNGQPIYNSLEYQVNGLKQTGTWHYLTPNKEIQIDLLNFSEKYVLRDLTLDSVKLVTGSNDIIELIKA